MYKLTLKVQSTKDPRRAKSYPIDGELIRGYDRDDREFKYAITAVLPKSLVQHLKEFEDHTNLWVVDSKGKKVKVTYDGEQGGGFFMKSRSVFVGKKGSALFDLLRGHLEKEIYNH